MNGKERMQLILDIAPALSSMSSGHDVLLKEIKRVFPHYANDHQLDLIYLSDVEIRWIHNRIVPPKPVDVNAAYDRAMGIV